MHREGKHLLSPASFSPGSSEILSSSGGQRQLQRVFLSKQEDFPRNNYIINERVAAKIKINIHADVDDWMGAYSWMMELNVFSAFQALKGMTKGGM